MENKPKLSRRESLQNLGALGAAAILATQNSTLGAESAIDEPERPDARAQIAKMVAETSFVDTHEHLFEESRRFGENKHPWVGSDDWSILFGGYLFSDLLTAGLPVENKEDTYTHSFLDADLDPKAKWEIIAQYWPAVKNTGYGLAIRHSVRELYGVRDLSKDTVVAVQEGYEKLRRPGFYRKVLCDVANIESCQVNSFSGPFEGSAQPKLLMQDMNLAPLLATELFPSIEGWDRDTCQAPTNIDVRSLADWHGVIDWWFDKYGRYAVSAKSQIAYNRDIDHARVEAKRAEKPFEKLMGEQPLTEEEKKALEDHLFWYNVEKAKQYSLPVKLHTGYYAGENKMPLSRLINNPGSACDLCRSPDPHLRFVFMHICYPYYEELISVAKQYTNAYVDMCWAWIINPIAAKDFLKKYLVTAPANKILTFGADYVFVENVVGHAVMARQGITQALSELVEEQWLSLDDALELVEPIMRGNARQLFRLREKERLLSNAPWL